MGLDTYAFNDWSWGVRSRLPTELSTWKLGRVFCLPVQGDARVLFDAEPTTFQPAIDALIILMQQEFNRYEAVIMNTYQCYLKVGVRLYPGLRVSF